MTRIAPLPTMQGNTGMLSLSALCFSSKVFVLEIGCSLKKPDLYVVTWKNDFFLSLIIINQY